MSCTSSPLADNKLTDGNLYPYSGITRITNELTKLKLTYKVTTEAVAEAKKLLAKEITQQEQTKWHLEQRKKSGNDYKVQMDKLQREIASLQSTIPLISEPFFSFTVTVHLVKSY